MAKDLSSRSDYHNEKPIKRADIPLAATPTAKEYLASGKPTKSYDTKAAEGYTKVSTGPGVYEIKKTDKAKEYLAKIK